MTDQEKAITTTEIKENLAENNINLHFTSVNASNSNSPVERFYSTLQEHLRILMNTEKLIFKESLNKALHAYNNFINTITKFTPFELFFGRKFDEPLEAVISRIKEHKVELQSKAYNNSLNKKKQYIDQLNKHRDEPQENYPEETYRRLKTTSILQKMNQKTNIQRKTDIKFHMKSFNKPRKFTLQDRGLQPDRGAGDDEQPRDDSDSDE